MTGASKVNSEGRVPTIRLIVVTNVHADPVPGGEVHNSVVCVDHDAVEHCVAPRRAVGVDSDTAKLNPSTVSGWFPAITPFDGFSLVSTAAS
jgi:hypothetical protein